MPFDRTTVDDAIRAASARIQHFTDSDDCIQATRKLDEIRDALSR